ncbi:MAG: class I SAM-dependent methyltransferase [Microgenomates group bacterium]
MSIYHKHFSPKQILDQNTSYSKILSKIHSAPQRVLDIGCASGYFGEVIIKKYKTEVWGIDSNLKDINIAAKKLTRVMKLDIENYDFRKIKEKFDLIILADIIEHLKNPSILLTKVQHLLTPTGIVICSVPNFLHFSIKCKIMNNNWSYESFGLLDKTHLHFFGYNSLVSLLESTNYYIYDMDFVTTELSRKLLLKSLVGSDIPLTAGHIDKLFSLESRIFQYIIVMGTKKPIKYNSYLNKKLSVLQENKTKSLFNRLVSFIIPIFQKIYGKQ